MHTVSVWRHSLAHGSVNMQQAWAETRLSSIFRFLSTHICRLRHNVIPRNACEGHREITMSKIMLLVKQQTSNKAGFERLFLQAVRIFRCDKVKHLSQSSAAMLVVPGQRKEWIGINTCMCIRRWPYTPAMQASFFMTTSIQESRSQRHEDYWTKQVLRVLCFHTREIAHLFLP